MIARAAGEAKGTIARALVATRRMKIGDRTVVEIVRTPPIAPTLQLLLEGGRDETGRLWTPLRTTFTDPLRLAGPSASCLASSNGDPELDHRLRRWVEGFYLGRDGLSRYLSLHACADCGAVCVRDRSVDSLADVSGVATDIRSAGRRPLRRRDAVIGWYSGARPRQRVYT